MILIGYSGHSFVASAILREMGLPPTAYCDVEKKIENPLELEYLGKEDDEYALEKLRKESFFISIGENKIRRKIFHNLTEHHLYPITIIHPKALIGPNTLISERGVMVCGGVVVNPFVKVAKGVILNSCSIVEHQCIVSDFAHVGPGAVLCGNVHLGENSFVGAGAIVKEGIQIGKNVVIGAGAVVLKNIPDNTIVVGNPAKPMK